MDTVIINRFDRSDHGVFGKVAYKGFIKYTGELPDRNNQSNISCIPSGLYTVKWTPSPRMKKYTYEILSVPKRGGIRMHSSNLMGDASLGYKAQLLGCISLGEKLGYMGGQKALLLSGPAMRHFEAVMAYQPFLLEIK
jgi:hypothetical protein